MPTINTVLIAIHLLFVTYCCAVNGKIEVDFIKKYLLINSFTTDTHHPSATTPSNTTTGL